MRRLLFVIALISGASCNALGQQRVQEKSGNDLISLIGREQSKQLLVRLDSLNQDIATKGLRDHPGVDGKLLTGYAYGEYYDWDLYFENLYLSYYGISDYDLTNLKLFLDKQQPDGFVSRTIGITYPRPTQMFKPFMAQLVVLGASQTGNNYEWLRANYYTRLQKYIDRWFAYDHDGNGLPVWNSSDASGMDNQISRSGDLESYHDEGVDLACYLYRELQAMKIIASKLGKSADSKMYADRAEKLAMAINKVFWSEKDGFYYDRDEKTGKAIKVKSVAGFLPMWAGVANAAQARRLVHDHLMNEKEFWLKYPVATYAKSEPDFYEGSKSGECNWKGPAWIPTNYMIFHGLLQYGYNEEAKELTLRTLQLALVANPVTREFYDSDTGKGNGMDPFWGWSSLAYVMPIDLARRYDPMDLHSQVRPLIKSDLGLTFSRAEK
jgi:putative isomerase